MSTLSLHSPINIRCQNDTIEISNDLTNYTVDPDTDIIHPEEKSSLKSWLENDKIKKITIESNHVWYSKLNAVLADHYQSEWCIYDCEQMKWMAITDGDVNWTENNWDISVTTYDDYNHISDTLSDEDPELYAIQHRITPSAGKPCNSQKFQIPQFITRG